MNSRGAGRSSKAGKNWQFERPISCK